MKKRLLMMLAVTVLLVGCGNTETSDGEANTQSTETERTSEMESTSATERTSETESTSETEHTSETESINETERASETESTAETESASEPENTSETETSVANTEAHEHSYTEKITKEATCTKKGEKTFSCDCGDTYTESTKKLGHSYGEYVYNNDATQSADGTKSRTCSVCGKVDTKTAKGTKLPLDPYSLRAVTSLDEITNVGTLTSTENSTYNQVRKNIEAGKYEKIRYVASNGDQFCMWDVRLTDERDKEAYDIVTYYWFMAPIEDEFSNGYMYANFVAVDATDADKKMIAIGNNMSGSVNESMLNRNESIPMFFEKVNSAECPVNLYEIVETDNMVSVWVESTNCGQEGIGTCGTFDCKQTCLRYKTLENLQNMPIQKGWTNWTGGENGRINWNGKLLVNFCYLKY